MIQSFGLLLIGLEILSDPALTARFGLPNQAALQTVMFLQLVAGGHLLLFVTRSEGWFMRPPFPALPLVAAIVATQALAVLMCGFGWLVPQIPWKTDRLGLGLQSRVAAAARRRPRRRASGSSMT